MGASVPQDEEGLADLQTLLIGMTLAEIKKFCAGTLEAATIGQRMFRRRFPAEFAVWDENAAAGRLDYGDNDR